MCSDNFMKKSFSLLEVTLAITFLMVAVISAVLVIAYVLGLVSTSRNNVTAAQLAQEGIEIVRNLRDSNWLAGQSMDYQLVGASKSRVEWMTNSLLAPASPQSPCTDTSPLRYDLTYGYNYSYGTTTVFCRTVDITAGPLGNSQLELKVVVKVYWMEKGFQKKVIVEDHLFNWK